MKQRIRRFGCRRIARHVAKTFGVDIDKDLVRRVLAEHYRPGSDDDGSSSLTFLGQTKDSLWNIDLFRCESIHLEKHCVLVILDQFTRRIIGFSVHAGDVDGIAGAICSTQPFLPTVIRTTSVLTMTRYSGTTAGRRIVVDPGNRTVRRKG